MKHVSEILPNAFVLIEGLYGASSGLGSRTGLDKLDTLIGGWLPGRVYLLEGNLPGLCAELLLESAFSVTAGRRVSALYFSMTNSPENLVLKLVGAMSEVRTDHAGKLAQLSEHEWRSLIRAAGRLAESPLYINSSSAIDLEDLREACSAILNSNGSCVVFIDSLSAIEGLGSAADAVKRLRKLALDLKVPIITTDLASIVDPAKRTEAAPDAAMWLECEELEDGVYWDVHLEVECNTSGPTGRFELPYDLTRRFGLTRSCGEY